MERIFINLNFRGVDVVPLVNGSSWTTKDLCGQIISKYRAQGSFPNDIIVWFDRESNPDTSHMISESVRAAFASESYPREHVHCLIPDMMSENIILSHENTLRELTGNDQYTYSYEGDNGKHLMKEIYKQKKLSYKETIHGPKLLKKIRLRECHNDCHAIAEFLATFTTRCWWTG